MLYFIECRMSLWLDLPVDLETCVRLEIILLNEAQANNWHYLFNGKFMGRVGSKNAQPFF